MQQVQQRNKCNNATSATRRDFLVEVFDIAAHLRTPARKLSLGERMRCELAAALLHKPRLLFLVQLLRSFSWPLLGAMMGATVVMVSIATSVFYVGLRRYESGNLLGMQE